MKKSFSCFEYPRHKPIEKVNFFVDAYMVENDINAMDSMYFCECPVRGHSDW